MGNLTHPCTPMHTHTQSSKDFFTHYAHYCLNAAGGTKPEKAVRAMKALPKISDCSRGCSVSSKKMA